MGMGMNDAINELPVGGALDAMVKAVVVSLGSIFLSSQSSIRLLLFLMQAELLVAGALVIANKEAGADALVDVSSSSSYVMVVKVEAYMNAGGSLVVFKLGLMDTFYSSTRQAGENKWMRGTEDDSAGVDGGDGDPRVPPSSVEGGRNGDEEKVDCHAQV
ncbi:hypothetical protein BDQ12DRAFT_668170 [Crucibulum laeve]|uniref:Uncharacterized protein n=1 Tax=Crucibulum laeve TaxID=68775 RepID=A0A5C3LSC9_9AGAR|nr:hypothetical protein BDQ12DRAFT_668170 [Crucibulum laeve]